MPLLLLLRDSARLLGSQRPPHGTGLLRPKVEREILLLRVILAQSVALIGVGNCQDTGDGFAEIVTVASTLFDMLAIHS